MRICATAVVLALALAGCDRQSGEEAAAAAAATDATAVGSGDKGGFEDAVVAVPHAQGGPAATVSFLVETRPLAGKPFPLKVYFSAAQAMPGLEFTVESADLILTPASGTVNIAAPNQPVEQDLVVTAQRQGLWELVITLKTSESTAVTDYKIPVLVAAAG